MKHLREKKITSMKKHVVRLSTFQYVALCGIIYMGIFAFIGIMLYLGSEFLPVKYATANILREYSSMVITILGGIMSAMLVIWCILNIVWSVLKKLFQTIRKII